MGLQRPGSFKSPNHIQKTRRIYHSAMLAAVVGKHISHLSYKEPLDNQRMLVTIGGSRLRPVIGYHNITRQKTGIKSLTIPGVSLVLGSAGHQWSHHLCLSSADFRLKFVSLQLEGGFHLGTSGSPYVSVCVIEKPKIDGHQQIGS